jgi:ParB family chromosome partitioning protein
LKRPITVAPRAESSDGKRYDLVCGQGRLEAFVALGQTQIPAIVKEATKADCLLMSLVENVARRPYNPIELLREIGNLKTKGYTTAEIAKKIDVNKGYVRDIAHLLDRGEERLIHAVEKGRIPIYIAMRIANSDEGGIQEALRQAYEDKSIRGRKFLAVRRIIEARKELGKDLSRRARRKLDPLRSAKGLIRVYRKEADRQQLLVKKSQLAEHRMFFIVSALRKLFLDENLKNLLRAEGLDSMPAFLAEKVLAAAQA